MCYLTFRRTIRSGRLYPPISLLKDLENKTVEEDACFWQHNGSQFFLQNSKLPENEGGSHPTFCLVYHNWWQSCVLYKIISHGPREADELGAKARFRFSVLTGGLRSSFTAFVFKYRQAVCLTTVFSIHSENMQIPILKPIIIFVNI